MKFLILTQYFPPEVGAPQTRLLELGINLKKLGHEVTVLTAMPNYPQMEVHPKYKRKFYVNEQIEGINVHRSWIYASKNRAIYSRLLNYFSFVFTSLIIGLTKTGKFDYILCQSPSLFLGISAYVLKVTKKTQLIFNVSDLWPESAEKLGLVTNQAFLKLSSILENFMYRNSELITGQTQGIINNIIQRHPNKKILWLPNGVNIESINSKPVNAHWRINNGYKPNDFVLLYAGMIGYAQGLETIVLAAEQLKSNVNIKFCIVGSGPEKFKIEELIEQKRLKNIKTYNTVSKQEVASIIYSSNAGVIPLKKIDLFKHAIPSKVFEFLAYKKPILLGVEGEAKRLFIDKGKCGISFTPEDVNELCDSILSLQSDKDLSTEMGKNGYSFVKEHFTHIKRAEDLIESVNNLPKSN